MAWPNQYLRDLNYPEGEKDVAVVDASGRFGVLPDGTRLRVSGVLMQILHVGDWIETSYSREAKVKHPDWSIRELVIEIHEYGVYGMRVYGLAVVDEDARKWKSGKWHEKDKGWINELVLFDGRILHLFEANDDEVFIVEQAGSRQERL